MNLPPPPPPPWSPASATPMPPPPPAGNPGRSARWPGALAVAAVGLLLVAGVAMASRAFEQSGPSHPDQWDPRVRDLVAFVEQERGLPFVHPAQVDFLSAAEYTKQTAGKGGDDRKSLDRYAGELRALGVASGPLDLAKAFDQVSDGGTLAFYNPADERIRVRGTTLSVGLRVTLVHELTHVLQDQHFDLERLHSSELDNGASTAFRGLAEGDALRVEEAFKAKELTDAERADYDTEYASQLASSEQATSDVPDFVSASFATPYALGQPFAVLLFDAGGNARVDKAFLNPPDTEEHLFDPASFLAGEEAESGVKLGFPRGADVQDESPFGAPSWYLILAKRIDPKVAFEAALGWNGDDFGAVETDGRACVRAGFVGDLERDEQEMTAALSAWVATMPEAAGASVDQVDGHPVLVSCDPGESPDSHVTADSITALYLPSLWGYLEADASGTLDPEGARCYARHVVDGLDYADIIDPEGGSYSGDAFQQALSEAYDACG